MLKLCKKCWWWRGQTGGGGKASKTDDRDGAMVAQRQGWATIWFGITEQEPGFLFVWRQSWVLIWRFSWTWGALLRDNLNLFQVFIQFKTEVKHANTFSTLNVESGNNELNTCSINTHSNITPLSLPLQKEWANTLMILPQGHPTLPLASLASFPRQEVQLAHRSMTSFACQPASGGTWSNFRGQE